MALMIIAAWGVGYYMADLPGKDPNRMTLYSLHKSVGMCILILVVARLAWRLYDVRPRNPKVAKPMLLAAHAVHYLLYAFMFIQPITGWLMSSAAGYNPTFFGLFTFPGIVPKDPTMVGTYIELHEISAWILLGLFVAHVGGALYHYFFVKDDVLQRML